jgi:hypothetical protein
MAFALPSARSGRALRRQGDRPGWAQLTSDAHFHGAGQAPASRRLIERQRDQRESEVVFCARAPQRPVPDRSSLLPFAMHPAADTRKREPSSSNGQRRRTGSVETRCIDTDRDLRSRRETRNRRRGRLI